MLLYTWLQHKNNSVMLNQHNYFNGFFYWKKNDMKVLTLLVVNNIWSCKTTYYFNSFTENDGSMNSH